MAPSNSKQMVSSGTRIHPLWMLVHAVGVIVVPYYAGRHPLLAPLRPLTQDISEEEISSILLSPAGNKSLQAPPSPVVTVSERKKVIAPQHLQVDLSESSKSFLDNPEVFLKAIIKTTVDSLESYRNCRSLANGSFHCYAAFEDGSSLTFHATPRTATLTYFAIGDEHFLLLGIVDKLDNLFQDKLEMKYYHKGHGDFARDTTGSILGLPNPDFYDFVRLQESCEKDILLYETTGMQTVTVVEMPHAKDPHGSSVNGRHTYGDEARDAEDYPTRKELLLDGIAQSTLHGIEAYHEALVHMAMLTHPNPKRVAIIGGGEGATLREVLKFKSVEECTMVEIDDKLIELAEDKLREWNDCSDFILGEDHDEADGEEYRSCFKDPRSNMVLTDAVGWFINHFGPKAILHDVDKFDVVIMDALDPASKSFSNILYGNPDFTNAFMESLNDDGIFLSQFGETTDMDDHVDLDKAHRVFQEFLRLLQGAGAQSAKLYTEAHNEFEAPWSFLMVFKDNDSKTNFYAEPAWFDLKLAKQAIPLYSEKFPFGFIDGATAATYQYPSRVDEYVYCQQAPKPAECTIHRGYDRRAPSTPASSLILRESNMPNAGRGVFFQKDVPQGTLVAPEEESQSIICMPRARDIIVDMYDEDYGPWEKLMEFLWTYSPAKDHLGWKASVIGTGISSFMNHGCNSTYSLGRTTDANEFTPDLHKHPEYVLHQPFFSPYADRNFHVSTSFSHTGTRRDVTAGEEATCNYVAFTIGENWEENMKEFLSYCI